MIFHLAKNCTENEKGEDNCLYCSGKHSSGDLQGQTKHKEPQMFNSKNYEDNKHTSNRREYPHYVRALQLLKMKTSTDLEAKN